MSNLPPLTRARIEAERRASAIAARALIDRANASTVIATVTPKVAPLEAQNKETPANPAPQKTTNYTYPPEDVIDGILKICTAHATESSNTAPMIGEILSEVSAVFGVSVTEIKSAQRNKHVVLARQTAMWLAKKITRRSLPEIGYYIGQRDHTTVMHSIRATETRIDGDEDLRRAIVFLWRRLSNDPFPR